MKRLIAILVAVLGLTMSLEAAPSSTHFSTVPGAQFAWQLSRTNGNWLLSFPDDSSQIDSSSPADAALFADYVNLPAMVLADLQDQGTFFTATLTPTGPLTIVSDTGEEVVLTATMASRSSLFIGTNYMAYSNIADDLDITDHVPGYSSVIDAMVAGEAGGLPIDISFSGDAAGGLDLVSALRAGGGLNQLTGTSLSGQITVIPAPGALLLAGIGALTAAYLRRHTL